MGSPSTHHCPAKTVRLEERDPATQTAALSGYTGIAKIRSQELNSHALSVQQETCHINQLHTSPMAHCRNVPPTQHRPSRQWRLASAMKLFISSPVGFESNWPSPGAKNWNNSVLLKGLRVGLALMLALLLSVLIYALRQSKVNS